MMHLPTTATQVALPSLPLIRSSAGHGLCVSLCVCVFVCVCVCVCVYLHTVVTDGAMGAARGPVETAGGAPLHAHLNPPDLNRLVEGSSEVILLILILVRYTQTDKHKTLH